LRRIILAIDNRFFWKGATTNPHNGTVKPNQGPLSFAAMLAMMGKEKQTYNRVDNSFDERDKP
jgi:hypothetical protein